MRRIDEAAAAARAALDLGLSAEWKGMVHGRLAEGYLAAGRPRDAVASFAAAAAVLPPGHPYAGFVQTSRGLALLRLSDFGEAREALQAALDAQGPGTDPQTRASTLFNLALTLEHEGQLAEAQAHLRSALAVRATQGEAGRADAIDTELALARVLARSGAAHAAEARTLLDRTRPYLAPGKTAQGLHVWAAALLELATAGDTAQALAAMDRAAPMIKDESYARWIAEDRARLATRP
jgi:tetratricopeptide (TPR) repeat protein